MPGQTKIIPTAVKPDPTAVEIEEVNAIREMMDQEDINSIVANLKNLGNLGGGSGSQKEEDEIKEEKEVEEEPRQRLSLGDQLFGFENVAGSPSPKKSNQLGELEEGSDFKEAGILEEMMVSEQRNTMVEVLTEMIRNSKQANDEKVTGKRRVTGSGVDGRVELLDQPRQRVNKQEPRTNKSNCIGFHFIRTEHAGRVCRSESR